MKGVATDFEKIIHTGMHRPELPNRRGGGAFIVAQLEALSKHTLTQCLVTARERKKNEALADKIFSQGRRNGTPSRKPVAPGGSLASRVGVKKVCQYCSFHLPVS